MRQKILDNTPARFKDLKGMKPKEVMHLANEDSIKSLRQTIEPSESIKISMNKESTRY